VGGKNCKAGGRGGDGPAGLKLLKKGRANEKVNLAPPEKTNVGGRESSWTIATTGTLVRDDRECVTSRSGEKKKKSLQGTQKRRKEKPVPAARPVDERAKKGGGEKLATGQGHTDVQTASGDIPGKQTNSKARSFWEKHFELAGSLGASATLWRMKGEPRN